MGRHRSVPKKGKRAVAEIRNPWQSGAADTPWSRVAPFAAFVALAALYIVTLNPSVAGGDSGELTAAAITGGVPHPSGYPLFALLARLFAALPLGHSPAWRVNLLSALSMAAAGGLVCAVVQSWTRNATAGLMAAALFGTSPVVWANATSAEVFGLNAMLVGLALYLWSRVEMTLSRRAVFALLAASGLAMCNHHTFVFVGAPLVLRSLWVARHNLGGKGVALALGCGIAGLLPHLYLVAASASTAAVSWGDATTVDGLAAIVLRRDYGTFSMGRPTEDAVFVTQGTFFPTLAHVWGRAFPRLFWFGPVLALLGLHLGMKSRTTRKAAAVLLFVFGFYGLSYCALSNLSLSRPLYVSILGRFCIESDLLLAIASGFGLAAVLQWLDTRWPALRAWLGLLPVSTGALFGVAVAVHAGEAMGSPSTALQDFVTTAFASLPPNAIAITVGDEVTNSAFYLHEVEKLRPDVIHLGRTYLAADWYTARERRLHPDLHLPEGGYGPRGWNIKWLLDRNPNRPLMVIGHLDDWDESWQAGYKLVTYGLVYSLVRPGEFPTYQEWLNRDGKAMGRYDVVPALRASEQSWENALGQRVLGTQVGRAHLALVYSSAEGDAPEPARTAVGLLEDVIAKAGGDSKLGIAGWPGLRKLELGPQLWKDLGVAYQILSRSGGNYDPRIAVAYQKFIDQADAKDPDLPTARQVVEAARAARIEAVFKQRFKPPGQ